ITDTISNLQRIETLVNRLDQPTLSGLHPKFYKVQNTTASELVTKLQSILTGASATQLGTGTSFQADDRTNQIILLSDPRQFAFFDDLIAKLDTVGESSTRQEVIPLKHATATDIATVLSTLVSGQNTAARAANQATQGQAAARTAAARANQPQPNQPQPNPNQAAALAAAQARLNQLAGSQGAANESAPQQFSSILTIVAEERSNALVVSGTVDDMRLIKDLVAELDVLLAQVRIASRPSA
ncbi:MAG: type II secretory pathway, component PulD, partial [Opitutae bacterium]|nr:type II secretory pathway, component PulD [Opitutae bacterium]